MQITSSIFKTSEFPALANFSGYWGTIREEALKLDDFAFPFERLNLDHHEALQKIAATGRNGWIKAWGQTKDKWLHYGFRYENYLITQIVEDYSCPKIMSLVKQLKGVRIVALSLLKPGAYILPHTHPELKEDGLLTYHLGLSVPDNWHWLNIDGTFVQHQEGQSFVFDGSQPHFAFNFSPTNRLILYIEFYKNHIGFNEDFLELD
ncbi:MAG: aspartyl/asparaginyl beta-hydroxylase domain-containing protein [Pleurocapsa sp.]